MRQLVFKYVGGEDPDLVGMEPAFRVVEPGKVLLEISWNEELLEAISRLASHQHGLERFIDHIYETSEDWSNRVSVVGSNDRLNKEFALNQRDFKQLPEFLIPMLGLDSNGQVRTDVDLAARLKVRVERLSSLLYVGGEPLIIPQFKGSLDQVLDHYGQIKPKQGEWRLLVVNEGDQEPIIIPVTAGLHKEAISKEHKFLSEMRANFLARPDEARVAPITVIAPTTSYEGVLSLCTALHLKITPALARDIFSGAPITSDRLIESARSLAICHVVNSASVSLGVARNWTTETTIGFPLAPRFPLIKILHQSGTFDEESNRVESASTSDKQLLLTWAAATALTLSRTELPIRWSICRALIKVIVEDHSVPQESMTMDWGVLSPFDGSPTPESN